MSLAIAGYLPDIPLPRYEPSAQPPAPPPRGRGRPRIDLKWQWFGSLRVLGRSEVVDKHGPRWRCKCRRCGAIVELRTDHLRSRERYEGTCGCASPTRRVWRWWLE